MRLQLPFDSEVLAYLLKVAPVSQERELLELVADFCPRWSSQDQASLAKMLLDYEDDSGHANSTSRGRVAAASVSGGWPASADTPHPAPMSAASGDNGLNSRAQREAAADLMLAQMLQEEEEAELSLSGRQNARPSAKKGKKSFKPMNINYTVAHNATPAMLGTAQPASLADLLRSRRQQQGQRPGIGAFPESFGPPASRQPSGFAPVPQDNPGLTWAERAQVAAEQAAAAEREMAAAQAAAAAAEAATPAPTAARPVQSVVPGGVQFKVLSGTGAEYQLSAGLNESVGDVKARIEKLHSVPLARQRLLYMGRELADTLEVRSIGLQSGQPLQLALRNAGPSSRQAPPPPSGGPPVHSAASRVVPTTGGWHSQSSPTMLLKLRLPGGVTAQVEDVAESASVRDLKQRIQQEHGIRADHILLTFFGCPLPDASKLADCGIATGAQLDVALRPPGAASDMLAEAAPAARELNPSPAAGAARPPAGQETSSSTAAPKGKKKKKNKGREADEGHGSLSADASAAAIAAHRGNPQSAEPPSGRLAAASKRADLVRKVFAACDADGDGRLKEEELMSFAVGTGFDGSREDWAEEYRSLCRENGCEPADGVDEEVLARLIDDESDTGCYCTNDELRSMLSTLEDKVQPPRSATAQTTQPPPQLPPQQQHQHQQPEVVDLRESSIRDLFQMCDVSADGRLSVEEMRTFAELTGFEGSAEEWAEEFAMLCSENGVDLSKGIHIELFVQFVNDESDSGQYCTDDEIEEMLQTLRRRPQPQKPAPAVQVVPALAPTRAATPAIAPVPAQREEPAMQQLQPPPSSSLGAPPRPSAKDASDAPLAMTREQLVGAVFRACDADEDGMLRCEEMRDFAVLSGFDGSEEDWTSEYESLCQEAGCKNGGLDETCLAQLVDDDSDNGCYCTDEELRSMLRELFPKVKARADAKSRSQTTDAAPPAVPPRPSRPPGLATPDFAPAAPPYTGPLPMNPALEEVKVFDRDGLIEAAFAACDIDGDDRLSSSEMRVFAGWIGFQGGDADWAAEFASLLADSNTRPSDGVSLDLFTTLVNDQSDDGCYCTDEELRLLLTKLQALHCP